MKRLVLILVLVVTSQAVWAQSRSSANVIQRGGAPNLISLLVGLVPAEPLELTGAVDSNSPAVWDLVSGQQTMVVLTSFAGRTSRALGNLDALTPAVPSNFAPGLVVACGWKPLSLRLTARGTATTTTNALQRRVATRRRLSLASVPRVRRIAGRRGSTLG